MGEMSDPISGYGEAIELRWQHSAKAMGRGPSSTAWIQSRVGAFKEFIAREYVRRHML